MSCTKFVAPVLKDVTHKDSQWIIQLQNTNNDKAEAILSNDYKVISASINDKSVYPK
jgi:hypothetical protein